jgi:predicted phage terminase large subunit-like protein
MSTRTEWWDRAIEVLNPPPRRFPTPNHLAAAIDPAWRVSPVTRAIGNALAELVEQDDYDALAVFVSPQEGKSQLCSRRFPEWVLDHDPAVPVAIVSYEADTARRWGLAVKQDVAHAGLSFSISPDSKAAGRWDTPQGGGVYCTGIGGPLTGRPVSVLIVDDPVKDRAAAESKVIREATWDWWESVALSRLAPGARVCLVQTRWHEDDLAGRILSRPSPLRWKVLTLPAIAEEDDYLGRQPGEELPSVRGRAPGHFYKLRSTLSPYVFASIHQQHPTAAEGNFFRRAAFRFWRPAEPWSDGRERITLESQPVTLADCWTFMTVDVAASSRTSADWTVCAAWMIDLAGNLILLDRARERVSMADHFSMALPLLRRWGIQQMFVERQFYASTLVEDARQAGFPVAEVRADTDKVTRAIPAAARVHSGRVWFPAEVGWLDEWCDELATFPQGTFDDQVDTLSYAARVQAHEWTPPAPAPRMDLSAYDRAVSAAHHAATGDGFTDVLANPEI